jgi:hypothetical protein
MSGFAGSVPQRCETVEQLAIAALGEDRLEALRELRVVTIQRERL